MSDLERNIYELELNKYTHTHKVKQETSKK